MLKTVAGPQAPRKGASNSFQGGWEYDDLPLSPLTLEDRLTYAKWVQGLAIIYTSALVLLALIIAQRIIAEPAPSLTNVVEKGPLLDSHGALKQLPPKERAQASVKSSGR
jgi:hypothetical protein